MDQMKDIRRLFRTLDIGRQYIKRFKSKDIISLDQLSGMDKETLTEIIGDDFDGTLDILWEWVESTNTFVTKEDVESANYANLSRKKEVEVEKEGENEEEKRIMDAEKEIEDEEEREEKIRLYKTQDYGKEKHLMQLAVKISKSKNFKAINKKIGEKYFKDLNTGRNIVECIMRVESTSESKAKVIAEEMFDEGIFVNVKGGDKFTVDSMDYYKICFLDKLDCLEEQVTVETTSEEISNSKAKALDGELNKISKACLENILRMDKLVEKSTDLAGLMEENFENDDFKIEISKNGYMNGNYLREVAKKGFEFNEDEEFNYKDERDILEVFTLSCYKAIGENEKKIEEIFSKQMETFDEITKHSNDFEKVHQSLVELGVTEGNTIKGPEKVDAVKFESYEAFEESRKERLQTRKIMLMSDYKAYVTIRDVTPLSLEAKNIFVVVKIGKKAKKTAIGEYVEDKKVFKFKNNKLCFDISKRELETKELSVSVKSYENLKSKVEVSSNMSLKKRIVKNGKNFQFKNVKLKDDSKEVCKIKIKINVEGRGGE